MKLKLNCETHKCRCIFDTKENAINFYANPSATLDWCVDAADGEPPFDKAQVPVEIGTVKFDMIDINGNVVDCSISQQIELELSDGKTMEDFNNWLEDDFGHSVVSFNIDGLSGIDESKFEGIRVLD